MRSTFARLLEILADASFPVNLKCAETASGMQGKDIERVLNDTNWLLGYSVTENKIYREE
ncbi:MAG: hypothetical protein BWY15_00448 [Firmicutes bacterium ADurb.Bin193]|nr:MAG: hypothetical protein BWY15_00448 [Firmicutes bacterium ADurb.Bin193]